MTQDATKTTKELLQELAVLRQRVGLLEAADVARQQANATLAHQVRSLTFALSSPLLSTLGLEAALAHLGEQMGDEYGFRFQCTTDR